jgi:hypothetical protein
MKTLWLILLLALPGTLQAVTPIDVKLQHRDAAETQTRDQLLRLLKTHDVEKWLFTRKVVIDSGPDVIPHSHPVLTLSTRHLKDDDLLLATFLHEQLHHFLEANPEKREAAIKELRALYPKVPAGGREGARSEDSSYLHLIVNYLEIRAVRELLGELRAFQILQFWAQDHYTWIYRKVMEEGYKIGPIVRKHGLIPEDQSRKPAG